MVPEIKYAKSSDVHIAYQVLGKGPIDLVLVPGWVSNIEIFWEEPALVRFLQRLASFSRLILFDKRGTGLSDRVCYTPTLEERMDDVLVAKLTSNELRKVCANGSCFHHHVNTIIHDRGSKNYLGSPRV